MPNELFGAIASHRPVVVLGDNDASRSVEEDDIGWSLPFNQKKIDAFVHTVSVDDVIKKSRKIVKIREEYSKNRLMSRFVDQINSMH